MDLFTFENGIAFLTLTGLEIVLGIDNVIFISILVAKLPADRQEIARRTGLLLAMGLRLLLLLAISWLMVLTTPLFEVLGHGFSGRDLILVVGGMFLLGKATFEIHDKIEGPDEHDISKPPRHASFWGVLIQILLLDVIFSLDSVLTAVGMVNEIAIMMVAVIVAVLVMLFFAKAIGEFIERNPTFKMLALSFLLLVGVMLVMDGFGKHVEKGYIYFAIGFSLFVEFMNLKVRRRRKPRPVAA
ncbi:MAG: TerC family protein [Bdellovibrionales bacterium]|nr:TerC family protein [Bdellovibrionales bacterium]